MKKIILFTAFSLALIAALGYLVITQDDLGLVTIQFGKHIIDMNFIVTGAFIALALLVWSLVKMLLQGLRFRKLRKGVKKRSFSKINQKVNDGFLAFSQGDWNGTLKNLMPVVKKSKHVEMLYLTAAKAAEAKGDTRKADAYLEEVAQNEQWFDAAQLHYADFLLQRGEFEAAEKAFESINQSLGGNTHVKQSLVGFYEERQEWEKITALLDKSEGQDMGLSAVAKRAWHERLKAVSEAEDGVKDKDVEALWRVIPRAIQQDPEVYKQYIIALNAAGESDKALALIDTELKKNWRGDLVALYGRFESSKPTKQLEQAEKWLKTAGPSPALMTALGRLSARNQLWGKAKTYFTESVRLQPSTEGYAELAKLSHALGEHEASVEYLNKHMDLSV